MRKFSSALIAFGLIVVAALYWIAAMSPVVAVAADSFEPNDTAATARGPFASGSSWSSYISTSNDRDHYWFYVSGPGAVHITFQRPSTVKMVALLWTVEDAKFWGTNLNGADAATNWGGADTQAIDYTVPSAGYYCITVMDYYWGGGSHYDPNNRYYLTLSGPTITTRLPVYRFYNRNNGSHFYTASESEKDNVLNTLSNVYTLDGVAYSVNLGNSANSSPLYRFYNKRNGSHFYTASVSEKDSVIANLAATYAYDGPAYKVCKTASTTTVWRFFNKKNGSHFYTASPAEKNNVINTLGATYALDGPAFYVAP